MDDIWCIDSCIPLKDRYIVELIRGAVMCIVWLKRNKLCFTDHKCRTLRSIGMQILSLITFWCKNNTKGNVLNLITIMPQDIEQIPLQVELRREEEDLATPLGSGEEGRYS